MTTITTTDGAVLADALFGGEASTAYALAIAKAALAETRAHLAEFDEDVARGCLFTDNIDRMVWNASHTHTQRQRVLDNIARWEAAIARREARLAELRSGAVEQREDDRTLQGTLSDARSALQPGDLPTLEELAELRAGKGGKR